ncbi:FAST kinase domain-containing protein 3, mitochondrial [Erpetoichthys calabaricus]|uniref:FAST kinase domains 3 n=1 Tax=Erpetoichthys calabaricus TaxID=27687 RepID=A0A8C4RRX0_ERPCA|nr:FAST kinase domain-containing protein 3, mitochondrial [Erpetoichthys calabaricus]
MFQRVTLSAQKFRSLQDSQRAVQCIIAMHGKAGQKSLCNTLSLNDSKHREFTSYRDLQKMYLSSLVGHTYFDSGAVCLHNSVSDKFSKEAVAVDEKIFINQLSNCMSSKQVLRLLDTLELIPNVIATVALQRIADLEHDAAFSNTSALMNSNSFKVLCFQLEKKSTCLADTSLVTALRACTQLCVDPWSTFVVRLISESQERLDRGLMSIKNLCSLGESMLALEGPGCVMVKQIMEQIKKHDLELWTPEDITMVYKLFQSGVGEGGQYQDLLNSMSTFTRTISFKMTPTSISQILHTLVVLNQTQAMPLVLSLCKHSVRKVADFSDDELVQVLGALIHFGQSDSYFTEALERHIPKKVFTMHPEAVSKVMQYCSRRRILSPPIFDTVAESFVYKADTFSTSQIARQIMPFGKLNYLPPNAGELFRKVEGVLRDRFSQFQPRTLLNLLHACTLIERFPVNFLAKVFSPYFLQQVEAQGTGLDRTVLAQLTQLFMTMKLECPFYEGPHLHSKYWVKSFLSPAGQSMESPVDGYLYNMVKNALVDLLGARIYFASRVLTPYCYTLDVEIKLDEEGYVLPATYHDEVCQRIAVCIDGQNRFCSNSQNLLGKEAIKQRHLKLLGYEIVQIPFYEFENLNGKEEAMQYLHKKIFPHSYRHSW